MILAWLSPFKFVGGLQFLTDSLSSYECLNIKIGKCFNTPKFKQNMDNFHPLAVVSCSSERQFKWVKLKLFNKQYPRT